MLPRSIICNLVLVTNVLETGYVKDTLIIDNKSKLYIHNSSVQSFRAGPVGSTALPWNKTARHTCLQPLFYLD